MGTKAFSMPSRNRKSLKTLATAPPRNPVAQTGASHVPQHLGHVDALAGGLGGQQLHPVGFPRPQGRNGHQLVQRGVQGYGENQGNHPFSKGHVKEKPSAPFPLAFPAEPES